MKNTVEISDAAIACFKGNLRDRKIGLQQQPACFITSQGVEKTGKTQTALTSQYTAEMGSAESSF